MAEVKAKKRTHFAPYYIPLGYAIVCIWLPSLQLVTQPFAFG